MTAATYPLLVVVALSSFAVMLIGVSIEDALRRR
jgi:hypothetical protein